MKELHKKTSSQIDSLMNLYTLPQAKKPGYRDSSHTLSSQLGSARRFLNTSTGAPTPNGMNAIRKAEKATQDVVSGVNRFFEIDWTNYLEKVKALSMDIYKEFEKVKIE
jgi:hypothetical protein